MKRVTLLATVILALAMSASASDMIDFTQLPSASTPQAMPANYHGLNWVSIDYVAPELWNDAGPGFRIGPEAQVAFGGGPLCYKNYGGTNDNGTPSKHICDAFILAGIGPEALTSFRPDYMIVSEGWNTDADQSIVVEAYNNGELVGSQRFNLQAKAHKFKLVMPNAWGAVTELHIVPSPGGSFVLYVLGLK